MDASVSSTATTAVYRRSSCEPRERRRRLGRETNEDRFACSVQSDAGRDRVTAITTRCGPSRSCTADATRDANARDPCVLHQPTALSPKTTRRKYGCVSSSCVGDSDHVSRPGAPGTVKKIDFKREWRELYRGRVTPTLVDVPPLTYAVVDGQGDPASGDDQTEGIEALFAFSYAAKFALRDLAGTAYGVLPLEGLWWGEDMAVYDRAVDRSRWQWCVMIARPHPLEDVLEDALARAAQKAPAVSRLRLATLSEGRCAQVLHVGAYDHEGADIARLHELIAANGLRPDGRHHEIYLSDPRRTPAERLKTILRQPVAAA